jgi:hypothetical protein
MNLYCCRSTAPGDRTTAISSAIVEAPSRSEAARAFDSVFGQSGTVRVCIQINRDQRLNPRIRVLRDGELQVA